MFAFEDCDLEVKPYCVRKTKIGTGGDELKITDVPPDRPFECLNHASEISRKVDVRLMRSDTPLTIKSVEQRPPLADWTEFHAQTRHIVSEVIKLIDGLQSSIRDETFALEQCQRAIDDDDDVECNRVIKKSIKKCRLFQASDLVESLMAHITNWDSLCKTWTSVRTGFYSTSSSITSSIASQGIHRRTTAELRATLQSRTAQFAVHLHNAVLIGLQMMAVVGIETLTASLLQKAIVGVVALNNVLVVIRNNVEPVHVKQFTMLPAPVSIKKILSIIGEQQSMKMANILAEILEETMINDQHESAAGIEQRQKISPNDGQGLFQTTSAVNPRNRSINPINDENPDRCLATSDYGSADTNACDPDEDLSGISTAAGGGRPIDDGLTRLRTMQSQDELNIGKLVSVIYLTFIDVVQAGGTQLSTSGRPAGDRVIRRGGQLLQQWWTSNDREESLELHHGRRTTSTNASEQSTGAAISNLSKYYKQILEANVVRSLKSDTRLLRDVILLPPTRIVDVGDCALKLCRSSEEKLPLMKVYRQLRSHVYVEAVRKIFDSGMSCALAAAWDAKCVTAVLIEGGQGTRAGRCFVTSLEPMVRLLELATINNKDLDVESIHFVVFPRLLASLQLTGSWLETRTRHALTSWQITAFCLITHSDLKMIIDLLKHTVNVNTVHSSRTLEDCVDVGGSHREVAVREIALRSVVTWEHINRAITKIQNCSSTCMKEFCRVCSGRIDVVLQRSMPHGKEWRQKCKKKGIPTECGPYARALVDEILGPVVDGVCRLPVHAQISILTMATKVLCEAWMAHILARQIKFSLHGAHLLKLDFGHLMDFLRSQPTLSFEARQSALALEVIRRMRGAAALLLRQNETDGLRLRRRKVAPMAAIGSESNDAEADRTSVDDAHRMEGMDSADSIASDSLVDEDYVLNKGQWLSLRVHASPSDNHRSPFWCFF